MRTAHARGTRTDHGDFFVSGDAGKRQGVAGLKCQVGDRSLNRPNRDRTITIIQSAGTFTKVVVRADPAENLREWRAFIGKQERLF